MTSTESVILKSIAELQPKTNYTLAKINVIRINHHKRFPVEKGKRLSSSGSGYEYLYDEKEVLAWLAVHETRPCHRPKGSKNKNKSESINTTITEKGFSNQLAMSFLKTRIHR